MRRRHLTLLVLIYVALDLVNPMMPGAFQFVGTSVETVAGCQQRTHDAPAPAAAMLPTDPFPVTPAREVSLKAPRQIPPPPSRLAAIPFRVALEPGSTATSSPDDD